MRMARFGLLLLVLAAPRPAGAEQERALEPLRHVVRRGQTLSQIAHKHGVSVEELCTANALERPDRIRPGKTLLIPVKASKTSPRGERPAARARRDKPALPARPSRPVDPYAKAPKRRGYLIVHSTVGRWEGVAVLPNGKIPDSARAGFARVMASWRTGERQPMSDELLRLLVRVSDHFGGRPLRVVSGYRPWSKTQHTPHSQHNVGRAADFSVPGVPNEVVRDFCRTFARAGVGYYPNSSFVHLDARGYASYWIDYSGPGKPPRYASRPADSSGGGS